MTVNLLLICFLLGAISMLILILALALLFYHPPAYPDRPDFE